MITGIGTPNSQSRIPRPMFASFEFLNRRENAKRDVRFQRGTEKLTCECRPKDQP
jgi:hypothetical protein